MASKNMQSDTAHDREKMGGLAKGLAIMELFNQGSEKLTVADAARGTNISRASARRCLLTLAELGYVSHDGKHFTPLRHLSQGPEASRTRSMSLIDSAQPVLSDVCARLQETISLVIRDGTDAVFIARAETDRMVSTGVRLGARLPAHSVAAGRLLLGALSDDDLRKYLNRAKIVARTPHTVTEPEQLFEIIRTAAKEGVCYNHEELELGVRAISIPVRINAAPLLAISLSTLASRMSPEEMEQECRPVLVKAALRLEQLAFPYMPSSQ